MVFYLIKADKKQTRIGYNLHCINHNNYEEVSLYERSAKGRS